MYNFNLSAITLKLSACGEIQTKDKGSSLKQFFFSAVIIMYYYTSLRSKCPLSNESCFIVMGGHFAGAL